MGQKKKKKSGAKRNKGRPPSKDKSLLSSLHGRDPDDVNDPLADEITVLNSIFQEDCSVVAENATSQITIKLRPYYKDMGSDDQDVSALLIVRCLPGYPYKCPKIQIVPEKGISQAHADNLYSILSEQASSDSREGRVMIFNLVEAAQEFLSEIVPMGQAQKQVTSLSSEDCGPLSQDSACLLRKDGSSVGPFVYGFVDLFGTFGEPWGIDLGVDRSNNSASMQSNSIQSSQNKSKLAQKKLDVDLKIGRIPSQKQLPVPATDLVEVECDVESVSNSSSGEAPADRLARNCLANAKKDTNNKQEAVNSRECVEIDESDHSYSGDDNSIENDSDNDDDSGDEDEKGDTYNISDSGSSGFINQSEVSQSSEKDLMMVHLLRLACSSKGPLADNLPQITSELCKLGILSDWAQDLALKPPSLFVSAFDNAFERYVKSTKVSQFWRATAYTEQPGGSLPSSRYLSDFEELQSLGRGGFGHVVLCKNKLDGRQYAVKKIRLRDKILPLNNRILREVATLSRLQHQHVVRYYQAWFESGIHVSLEDGLSGSVTAASFTISDKNTSSIDSLGHDNKFDSTYLYIQMEYCPRTLRQVFDSYQFDEESAWHFFRQIVEGLAHIHGQGIIHRDLTPNNIFFDARNDIKIGDFGLAKFLKLEQLDQEQATQPEITGLSIDGTSQVGTLFYIAPEIEQEWPKIDEKADMYSLGVMFFELWHPFGTAMERNVVLSDLKQKRILPPKWLAKFPEQGQLLRRLLSSIPSDRPSATELLETAFPPRMENEMLESVLHTMRSSEDTSVYNKVVGAIFDDEALRMREHHQHISGSKSSMNVESTIQFAEYATEVRDNVVEVAREVFKQHCAKHLEVIPMRLVDDSPQVFSTIKLLTQGGDMLELCKEVRLPFAAWAINRQKFSIKRYEIAYVHRRAVGHSAPSRYLQGDFDIIGGVSALTEAEVIKVTVDIIGHFFPAESCDIHLNHGDLLNAIWSWIGIKDEHRSKVAELLSLMGSLRPQSSGWKSRWVVIRRQLLQELRLAEVVVNRLQTVGSRFCGVADQAFPRLRGALPADKITRKALDELSALFSYLRTWKIEKNVYINALMSPSECYHRDIFFQVHLIPESNTGSLPEGLLLAVGGRYDYLLHQLSEPERRVNLPGAVGTSLALEMIIRHSSAEIRPARIEATSMVLVCSKGGGGLLTERMELASELWEENIRAEFVPLPDPSLTEQYEYANEHGIKYLVIIMDASSSQYDYVKVRHLELKKEKMVEREHLIKFLLDAMVTQFRNPLIWV
ncbi:hypothetical protein MLD38_038463 [Melastoma candidum]|uniref:Uncharacterized protein n=1 Tax=Melastoma candidum TaxID=119954 RepID=A0ACB9L069_9MYRT|nr:hypothetical protein MLD38_038463 [Melastoma candidum]